MEKEEKKKKKAFWRAAAAAAAAKKLAWLERGQATYRAYVHTQSFASAAAAMVAKDVNDQANYVQLTKVAGFLPFFPMEEL